MTLLHIETCTCFVFLFALVAALLTMFSPPCCFSLIQKDFTLREGSVPQRLPLTSRTEERIQLANPIHKSLSSPSQKKTACQ
jgi:hypothetical protein